MKLLRQIQNRDYSESKKQRQTRSTLSIRLRGIASHAPKDFDYKKELEDRTLYNTNE